MYKDSVNREKYTNKHFTIAQQLLESKTEDDRRSSSAQRWNFEPTPKHSQEISKGPWEQLSPYHLCSSSELDFKEIDGGNVAFEQGLYHEWQLMKESTISNKGGTIIIQDTGVELCIPPDALQEGMEKCLVQMRIIPLSLVAEPAQTFASNSSVIVELLPNHLSLRHRAKLTLPHCLQLKEGVQRRATVFTSHHEIGAKPCWKEVTANDPDQLYRLDESSCCIWLHSFCWVKYEVGDEIVEGRKIVIYTARKKILSKDYVAEVDVGYYPQLAGEGEIFSLNEDIIAAQKKPFIFLRNGEKPLHVYFEKCVPNMWRYPVTEKNPKLISFRSIALNDERCCPFLLEKVSAVDSTCVPTCVFKAWQDENEDIELTIRLEVDKERRASDETLVSTTSEEEDVGQKTCRRLSRDTSQPSLHDTRNQDFKVKSPDHLNTERSPNNFSTEISHTPTPFVEYPNSPDFLCGEREDQYWEVKDGTRTMTHKEDLGAVGGLLPSRHGQQMEALSERFQQMETVEELPDNPTCAWRMMLPMGQSNTVANFPVQNQYYNISHMYYKPPGSIILPSLLTFEGEPHPSNMFSINFKTMITIANRLDGPDVLGNNWERLAAELNFKSDEVLAFQRCDSPTKAIIMTAIRMGKLKSLDQLRNILKRIEREDAAAAVPYEEDQNTSDNSNQID